METPSQKLADIVLKRLVKEGLIDGKDEEKLTTRLGEGKLEAADWRLALEKKLPGMEGSTNE